MVALNPRQGEPSTGSPCDVEKILAVLDQALQDRDATVPRLRLLRQVLVDGDVTDATEEDLAWIGRFLTPAHVCMYAVPAFKAFEEHNKHGVEPPAGDPAIDLARQQLDAIGWGQLDGHRILDADALIEQHGAQAILYALWCSKGKAIRNRAGFVTWWLKQGHEAPKGWLPVELRKPVPESARSDAEPTGALSPAPEPQTPSEPEERPQEASEPPRTPEELQPLREELLAHLEPLMRPASVRAWIEPLALVSIDGLNRLILQAPDAFHAEWVNRQFAQPLRQACQAMGYEDYYCTWQPRETI